MSDVDVLQPLILRLGISNPTNGSEKETDLERKQKQ